MKKIIIKNGKVDFPEQITVGNAQEAVKREHVFVLVKATKEETKYVLHFGEKSGAQMNAEEQLAVERSYWPEEAKRSNTTINMYELKEGRNPLGILVTREKI